MLASVAAVAIVAALVTAGVGERTRRQRRDLARRWREAHPVAADGILPGAGPIVLRGGPRAALLLHGFGDSPQTLARQAHALHQHGWTVHAPLLPGHGRSIEAFAASNEAQWSAAAREAYDALCRAHTPVAVVGLSMGGALATTLAATASPPPAALVLLAPYLELSPDARAWTSVWRLWSVWCAWVPGNRVASIRDPVARRNSLGYGGSSPRQLRELRRVVDIATAAAGRVAVPTLVIHSTDDYRIPVDAAERAFARLGESAEDVSGTTGALQRELRWVTQSGHVITVDHDAGEVTNAMLEWLDRHIPRQTDAAQFHHG